MPSSRLWYEDNANNENADEADNGNYENVEEPGRKSCNTNDSGNNKNVKGEERPKKIELF